MNQTPRTNIASELSLVESQSILTLPADPLITTAAGDLVLLCGSDGVFAAYNSTGVLLHQFHSFSTVQEIRYVLNMDSILALEDPHPQEQVHNKICCLYKNWRLTPPTKAVEPSSSIELQLDQPMVSTGGKFVRLVLPVPDVLSIGTCSHSSTVAAINRHGIHLYKFVEPVDGIHVEAVTLVKMPHCDRIRHISLFHEYLCLQSAADVRVIKLKRFVRSKEFTASSQEDDASNLNSATAAVYDHPFMVEYRFDSDGNILQPYHPAQEIKLPSIESTRKKEESSATTTATTTATTAGPTAQEEVFGPLLDPEAECDILFSSAGSDTVMDVCAELLLHRVFQRQESGCLSAVLLPEFGVSRDPLLHQFDGRSTTQLFDPTPRLYGIRCAVVTPAECTLYELESTQQRIQTYTFPSHCVDVSFTSSLMVAISREQVFVYVLRNSQARSHLRGLESPPFLCSTLNILGLSSLVVTDEFIVLFSRLLDTSTGDPELDLAPATLYAQTSLSPTSVPTNFSITNHMASNSGTGSSDTLSGGFSNIQSTLLAISSPTVFAISMLQQVEALEDHDVITVQLLLIECLHLLYNAIQAPLLYSATVKQQQPQQQPQQQQEEEERGTAAAVTERRSTRILNKVHLSTCKGLMHKCTTHLGRMYVRNKEYDTAAIMFAHSDRPVSEVFNMLRAHAGGQSALLTYLDTVLFTPQLSNIVDDSEQLSLSVLQFYRAHAPQRLSLVILESPLAFYQSKQALLLLQSHISQMSSHSQEDHRQAHAIQPTYTDLLAEGLLLMDVRMPDEAAVRLRKLPIDVLVEFCTSNAKLLLPHHDESLLQDPLPTLDQQLHRLDKQLQQAVGSGGDELLLEEEEEEEEHHAHAAAKAHKEEEEQEEEQVEVEAKEEEEAAAREKEGTRDSERDSRAVSRRVRNITASLQADTLCVGQFLYQNNPGLLLEILLGISQQQLPFHVAVKYVLPVSITDMTSLLDNYLTHIIRSDSPLRTSTAASAPAMSQHWVAACAHYLVRLLAFIEQTATFHPSQLHDVCEDFKKQHSDKEFQTTHTYKFLQKINAVSIRYPDWCRSLPPFSHPALPATPTASKESPTPTPVLDTTVVTQLQQLCHQLLLLIAHVMQACTTTGTETLAATMLLEFFRTHIAQARARLVGHTTVPEYESYLDAASVLTHSSEQVAASVDFLLQHHVAALPLYLRDLNLAADKWQIVLEQFHSAATTRQLVPTMNLLEIYRHLLNLCALQLRPDQFLRVLPASGDLQFYLPYIQSCVQKYRSDLILQDVRNSSEKVLQSSEL